MIPEDRVARVEVDPAPTGFTQNELFVAQPLQMKPPDRRRKAADHIPRGGQLLGQSLQRALINRGPEEGNEASTPCDARANGFHRIAASGKSSLGAVRCRPSPSARNSTLSRRVGSRSAWVARAAANTRRANGCPSSLRLTAPGFLRAFNTTPGQEAITIFGGEPVEGDRAMAAALIFHEVAESGIGSSGRPDRGAPTRKLTRGICANQDSTAIRIPQCPGSPEATRPRPAPRAGARTGAPPRQRLWILGDGARRSRSHPPRNPAGRPGIQ